ncbi:hypothetical protein [Bosea vaviloviae]|uniref:PIN domain-containing protein n=1 Tax=Bosea vaviloviae TaxID=1526658 RepID=A0A1D7U3G8_9HYPH|nr:hypothetical protein [Bosea vaviloviae]AOO81905.1 hypothetical protein BHK69_16905 [Bosea vaviloviae]
MKPPSPVLIVDANIILSCALGLRGGDVLNFVGSRRLLTMSQYGVKEVENWSHDRDFAGTGWPSWSSANLRAALVRETIKPI